MPAKRREHTELNSALDYTRWLNYNLVLTCNYGNKKMQCLELGTVHKLMGTFAYDTKTDMHAHLKSEHALVIPQQLSECPSLALLRVSSPQHSKHFARNKLTPATIWRTSSLVDLICLSQSHSRHLAQYPIAVPHHTTQELHGALHSKLNPLELAEWYLAAPQKQRDLGQTHEKGIKEVLSCN